MLPALSLVALSLTGTNATMAVVILTVAVSVIGAYSSGFFQSPMDVAPNFAGSLTGLMNAIGSITPIISTPIAGAVLQNDVSASVLHETTLLEVIVPPNFLPPSLNW